MRPKAVSDQDEAELAKLMADAERENMEVSGDEGSEAEGDDEDLPDNQDAEDNEEEKEDDE